MFKQMFTNYPRLAWLVSGFLGWFVINTIAWIPILVLLNTVFKPIPSQEGLNQLYILPFCFLPGLMNIGIVIFLLIKRRWAALGWFAAGLSNLAVTYLMDFFASGQPSLITGLVSIFGTPFYMLFLF